MLPEVKLGGPSLVMLAAGVEVATGAVLIAAPSLFSTLLFGGELGAAGTAIARLGGIALLSLVAAVWPHGGTAPVSALRAMLLFSAGCALYLVSFGFRAETVGVILWPAAVAHGVLGILLARAKPDGGTP